MPEKKKEVVPEHITLEVKYLLVKFENLHTRL